MKNYDHKKIEKKWRKVWDKKKVYKTLNAAMAKAKKMKPYYVLDMFPYPSGAGLHVGHPRGYIASDVFARMKRMQGYNVLHPMGFDSFGLPAEQYAIQTGKNPAPFTEQLVKRYKEQLSILGFSYDWDRQVATHDPAFYKWTQWIFIQLYNSYYDTEKNKARPITELVKKFEKQDKAWKKLSEIEQQNILMKYRLAYEGYAEVNWCEEMGTVLANDEIIEKDGKMVSERGEYPVVKKQMRQWFMRITAYADRLLEGLNEIDWPESLKEIQRNWIGKSEGSEIDFKIRTNPSPQPSSQREEGAAPGYLTTDAKNYVKLKERAIEMRANPTSAEALLWKELKGNQIGGHFRQQQIIGPFIADFVCLKKMLIIEIDGDVHDNLKDRDQERTGILESLGYRVIRFSNDEVLKNTQKVLQDISNELARLPSLGEGLGMGCSEEMGKITVFTTRADTLFGVTYVVLAPEHEMVQQLKPQIKNWSEAEKYIAGVKAKSDEDRVAAKEKTGVELQGVFAINPANGEQVPVWIADYVLASYGTGAVMAVPAHDERDFEFANKYGLPLKQVVVPENRYKSIVVATTLDNAEAFKQELKRKGILFTLATSSISGREHIRVELTKHQLHDFTGLVQKDIKEGNWVEILGSESIVVLKHGVFNDLLDRADDWFAKFAEWEPHVRGQKNFWDMISKNSFLNEFICYREEGLLRNSGDFDGVSSAEARKAITEFVGGKLVTKYKMRDAIFARQRYWGEPIPLKHVSLEEKYKKVFVIPFYSEFPFELILKKEKTVETRSLDKPGRDKVKVGDVVKIVHLTTKRAIFARVTALWRFKNIREMWDRNPELVKEIRPEANIRSYEELHAFYANVDPGYEKRCDTHGLVAWRIQVLEGNSIETIPEKSLPLKLPNVKSYAPTGTGESPLASVSSWVKAGYETNTMPGWAGSSWYFLRYTDPKNNKAFAGDKELGYWFGKNGGVNMYVGGSEHATGHLLYSRFWHKALKDLGYVKTEEPFAALRNQGMIGGADGRKMSKRWGNVVNPDDVVRDLGADTMRVYEAFMGPFESHLPWSTDGIVGSRRFIERVWRLQEKVRTSSSEEVTKALHKMIKKVGEDIQGFGFNTAVSAMMIFVNAVEKAEGISVKDFKMFLQTLAPFAPHVTEELWSLMGEKKSIHVSGWPSYDPKRIVEDTVTLGVQVNGKVRAEVTIATDADEASVREAVFALEDVRKWTEGKEVKKFIYVPKKIISVVI